MLHNTRFPGKWLIVVLGTALALGGCYQPTATTEATAEQPSPALPIPASAADDLCNTIIQVGSPSMSEELDFWVPLPDRHAYFQAQLDKLKNNLDISVRLRTQFTDYDQELRNALQAGDPPELAALYFEQVVCLRNAGLLSPLTDLSAVKPGDFIPDIIGINTFDGTPYGLPWLRFGCTSNTLSLAALIKPSEKIAAVMEFLTAPEQQAANYNDLSAGGPEFYPTRQAVYGEVNPVQTCSRAGNTDLTPELLAGLIEAAGTAQSELGGVLGGKTLNPYAGASVAGEAGFEVIALPFNQPCSAAEQTAWRAGYPIIIGAMLVEEGNALKLPSGRYAIQCHPDGRCEGLVANGNSIGDLPLLLAENIGFEAVPPFAWYEPAEAGMFLMLIPGQQMGVDPICIAFDSFRWCFG